MQTNKQTNKQTINLYEINKEWEELHKRNATEPPRETKWINLIQVTGSKWDRNGIEMGSTVNEAIDDSA